MRRTRALPITNILVLALAPAALAADTPTIELDGDANGDVTIVAPGYYVDTDGEVFRTVTISASDVTLDGLTFGGGAGAGVKNGATGLHDVAILNNTFRGYTGRTITHGFAEGMSTAADRGARWTVSGNTILQAGNNATAIAMFNIDGVDLRNNQISFVEGTSGRRGFNLDSSSAIKVKDNVLAMGGAESLDGAALNSTSPWAIQLSMSDADIADIKLEKNTITGTFYGVVGLSQGNIDKLKVEGNTIRAYRGVTLNSGTAAPSAGTTFSDIKVSKNSFTSIGTGTIERYLVGLRDLHTTAPVSSSVCCASGFTIMYVDVDVKENVYAGTSVVLRTYANPDVTYVAVRASKNTAA